MSGEVKLWKEKELKTTKDNEPLFGVSSLRRYLAELVGTFALTAVAAGSDVVATITNGEVSSAARAVAPALIVMAMIYTVGNQSGAHFNPVVTLAFALRKDFPWKWLPGYWGAQLIGAVLAALLLRALFGPIRHIGATLPHYGMIVSLITEIMLTFLLITVILGTAANGKLVGHNAAIAVGGTIAAAGLFAISISGASMNPARSLGPFLVSGQLTDAWIYVVGPFAGAILAVVVAWLLRGPTNPDAAKVAKGE
jgi:aquaporin Z